MIVRLRSAELSRFERDYSRLSNREYWNPGLMPWTGGANRAHGGSEVAEVFGPEPNSSPAFF
jgi:hypothetical protein